MKHAALRASRLDGWRLLSVLLALSTVRAAADLPVVAVTHDDYRVDHSCILVIPEGLVLSDQNSNGVIHVGADGITMRFAPGSELCGAPPGTAWDGLEGIGIQTVGHRKIRIENARVHGYRCGILATRSDELVIDGGDFSDNFRQRLRSTPEAEEESDWLFPHHNDEQQWRQQYGAAVAIESSRAVIVRRIRVRRGQNGILLDRVEHAEIDDNDCSFLSGWGLALWRSSRNVIARNAFDFCVRGHVEGVYNRGQDSAGILCFEQCNENLFAENSVTHGGDGFFGFAGREALGELWMEAQRERLRRESGRPEVEDLIEVPAALARDLSRRGCNRNRLIGNDFSYAAAHGIELTFSEDNEILGNRIVENAICGVWGGYSSSTLIAANRFEGNGGMAYGLERGGVDIEHGADNWMLDNFFGNNRCGIHLWWDDDGPLHRLPGVRGNLRGIQGNVVAGNRFLINAAQPFGPARQESPLLVLQIRDTAAGHVRSNVYAGNTVEIRIPEARELDLPPGVELITQAPQLRNAAPKLRLPGSNRPVGARSHLRGRDRIVLDEWGPWDHESPIVRERRTVAGTRVYEFLGLARPIEVEVLTGAIRLEPPPTPIAGRTELRVAAMPGVHPFEFRVRSTNLDRRFRGTLVNARWQATFFAWGEDPRQDLGAWRALAEGPGAVRAELDGLSLAYAWGGPREQIAGVQFGDSAPGRDHFGMIARTRLNLAAGRWRFTTLSDDGVRVTVQGRPIIENWTWHGPTRDAVVLEQSVDSEVAIEVEHFEIDGYAVLELGIEPD